jgi:hypothetical protein
MSRGRINALPLKLMPIGQSLPLLSRLIIPKSFLTRRDDLMEIMDGPHGQTYTVVISQLQTDQWYASIDDNTLADAILDRLMHNAHRLQLKGESMRKILSQLTEDEHLSYKAHSVMRCEIRYSHSSGIGDHLRRNTHISTSLQDLI